MRVILTLTLLALAATAAADEFVIHQTIEGTSFRDWSSDRLSWRVDTDRGTIQPTIPGTSFRDYGRLGYKIENFGGRTRLRPTIPGTNFPDWSKPDQGFVIE